MLGFIFFQCVILIDLLCHISFQPGCNEWVCVPNAVHEWVWIITIPWSCSSWQHPTNDQSPDELALPLKHYVLSLRKCLFSHTMWTHIMMKRACFETAGYLNLTFYAWQCIFMGIDCVAWCWRECLLNNGNSILNIIHNTKT